MYTVVTTDFADADMLEAAQWYEVQQAGLGEKFLDDVERIFAFLATTPAMFRKIQTQVHQVPLKIFPYIVLYKIKGKIVSVVAVFGCSQNPKKKLKRI